MKKHFMQVLSIRSAMLSVAFLLMSLLSFSASAYDFEIDGISYNIKSATEHTVEVASLQNVPGSTDCVIPESVTWQDTQYSVVEIGTRAFYNCRAKTISIPASIIYILSNEYYTPNLTDIIVDEHNPSYCSVDGVLFNKDVTRIFRYPANRPDTTYSIPSTVTAIGNNAFKGCLNLQKIILSPVVETIEYGSFWSCISLVSMDFPDSVKSIGSDAMYFCHKLQTVSIGKSLFEIGNNPFAYCNSLTEISVDERNKFFCSIEGTLYRNLDAAELELVAFPIGRNADLYSFQDRVTVIGNKAFEGCKTLSDFVLPNKVKKIGVDAFASSSLKRITIPTSVSEIGSGAFSQSHELSEIIVSKENQLYSSIDGALYNKNQTSLLCCPAGYQAIEFDIPEGISTISQSAFSGCNKIVKINIPESVLNIGSNAFSYCTSLKSIVIPNSVKVIMHMILIGCTDLQNATIGSSVRLIDSYAFNYCNNISTITCLPTIPPVVYSNNFNTQVYQNATLYVPNGCKEAYSSAEMWSNFQNIVEMEPVGISDINAADGEVSVTVENGAIVVNGADGTAAVEVYAADGRCVYRGNDTEITGLAHGLYIVRVGSTVSKVVL